MLPFSRPGRTDSRRSFVFFFSCPLPVCRGYGERGAGGAIPGGATIKFKVEVTEIAGAPEGDEL